MFDCDRKVCSYHAHYLLYFQPTKENPVQLEHESYHAAEDQCEIAQNRVIAFMDEPANEGKQIPELFERQADFWERKICA